MSYRFKSEKEYQKFLVLNSEKWCTTFWGLKPKEVKEQWYLKPRKFFGKNSPKIDLLLTLEDGKRIGIEVKNPSQIYSELSRSVSQLLCYWVIAKQNGHPFDEMVIVTSEDFPFLKEVIKEFGLPIRVFLITREIHGEYK